jgi:hypothetical protein
MARELKSVANQLMAIPTLGADEEAVDAVLDFATAVQGFAGVLETQNDPATLVEAFLRGIEGDITGKALEMKQSQDSAVRQLGDAELRLVRARAALTARYNVEFL